MFRFTQSEIQNQYQSQLILCKMLQNVSFEIMICQRNFSRCLAIVVALMALPQPQVLAQSVPPDPEQLYQVSFPREGLTISEFKSQELFTEIDLSDTVNNSGDLRGKPLPLSPAISRDLREFWKMRVRAEDVQFLLPEYKLSADNGKANPFNNVIKFDNLQITEVSRDPNTNTVVVQGGVRLQFQDISNFFGKADTFSGRLSVCVKRRDTGAYLGACSQ
jgi:hypothetical protein